MRLAGLLLIFGEPCVEVDLPDAGALTRGQLAAVQLRTVVPSMRVSDDHPVIAGRREQPPGPGVDTQRLRAAQLDAAADRRADRELGGRSDPTSARFGQWSLSVMAPASTNFTTS